MDYEYRCVGDSSDDTGATGLWEAVGAVPETDPVFEGKLTDIVCNAPDLVLDKAMYNQVRDNWFCTSALYYNNWLCTPELYCRSAWRSSVWRWGVTRGLLMWTQTQMSQLSSLRATAFFCVTGIPSSTSTPGEASSLSVKIKVQVQVKTRLNSHSLTLQHAQIPGTTPSIIMDQ